MDKKYQEQLTWADQHKAENQSFIEETLPQRVDDLDNVFETLHNKAFEIIDCLKCANCCRTTSPIFEQEDLGRIAQYLKLSVGDFIQQYLHMDEDGDFVLNGSPCAFLQPDNTCSIYEVRPTACREYPHTDRKPMKEVLDLVVENALICPAVSKIVEEFRANY